MVEHLYIKINSSNLGNIMDMIEAINIIHENLTDGIRYPYYFRFDHPPVVSFKYLHPTDIGTSLYVLPDVSTSRILWTAFSKDDGVIIERKNNRHVWYDNGDTFTIPKIDAKNDKWFNFSLRFNLTKELYQKYLDILKHAEKLNA